MCVLCVVWVVYAAYGALQHGEKLNGVCVRGGGLKERQVALD